MSKEYLLKEEYWETNYFRCPVCNSYQRRKDFNTCPRCCPEDNRNRRKRSSRFDYKTAAELFAPHLEDRTEINASEFKALSNRILAAQNIFPTPRQRARAMRSLGWFYHRDSKYGSWRKEI